MGCKIIQYLQEKCLKLIQGLTIALIVCVFSGCSNKEIYDNVQHNQRLECQKLPPSQYDDCMKKAEESYDEYQRKKESLEK